MKLIQFVRNHSAVFFLAALAASGVVYLGWAIGANVNCIAGTCSSTTGETDSTSPYDATTVLANGRTLFTGENDTASIECTLGTGTYLLGGGNDVAYLRDPQAASPGVVTVLGESGDDVILSQCTSNNNILNGVAGNDFLAGDANDFLIGDAGNDLLAGGQGNDLLNGGNGNDVLVGGPGTDTYTTADNDGDDIVIIHAGDVPAGNNETYNCENNDTILLFGFNLDLVQTKLNTETTGNFYNLTAAPGGLLGNQVAIGDPVSNPAGNPAGARYTFTADNGGATGTCTIIVVD